MAVDNAYVKASVLGRAPADVQVDVPIFVRWASGKQHVDPNAKPDPMMSWEATGWEIRFADDATTSVRCWPSPHGDAVQGVYADQPGRWNYPGKSVFTFPWDFGDPKAVPPRPGWKGGFGNNDNGMLIDYENGDGWELLNARPATAVDIFLINLRQLFPLWGPGVKPKARTGDWVCDTASFRTAANWGTYNGRGLGKKPKRWCQIPAAEWVAAREARTGIGHAFAVVAAFMETGPKARFLAPATRVEHPTEINGMSKIHPNAPDPRLTRQGLRVASTLTPADIDRRLEALYPDDPEWRETVRVAWMTMSEHGAIIGAETGNYQLTIQNTPMAPGYADSEVWTEDLGFTQTRCRTIWNGFPWDSLYAVTPSP